jgi:hypothetical protein
MAPKIEAAEHRLQVQTPTYSCHDNQEESEQRAIELPAIILSPVVVVVKATTLNRQQGIIERSHVHQHKRRKRYGTEEGRCSCSSRCPFQRVA